MEQKHWFMQWFEDSSKKNLQQKIEEACIYFNDKYGEYPKFVFVSKQDYIEDKELTFSFGNIGLRYNKQVLSNIYWIGKEDVLIGNKK